MSNIFDKELEQRHSFAASILSCAINRDRLSHAYLFSGRAQEDKWLMAKSVACHLNCQQVAAGNAEACHLQFESFSHCVNCKWIEEEKHPQAWLTLSGEGKKSGKIAVEKARQLSEELAKLSEFFRVVVIEDASQESFHRPAANALLKTIENPSARCIFFLFAVREQDVLPTVVSRCQVVPMQNPQVKQSPLSQAVLKTGLGTESEPALRADLDSLKQFFDRLFLARDSNETIRALEFAKQIQFTIDNSDEEDAACVIDFAVNLEIARLGAQAGIHLRAAGYLADLLTLAEQTKLQIGHYVSTKAAIETFVLSWWQLRQAVRC